MLSYELIYPHLMYGMIMWCITSSQELQRVLVYSKNQLVIAGLRRMESIQRKAFQDLEIITFPSLYIYELLGAYIDWLKCKLLYNRDFHNYNTRGENFL